MSTSNTVSIITPAYNCANTIGEAIESVLQQTHTDWEMIIVDDCSTDNTVEVVSRYVSRDKRIRLISHDSNHGAAAARNRAIRDANGRFIALLDSDDLWKPQKLESQLEFMKKNGYAFTFTAYEVFRDSSDLHRRVFEAPKSIDYFQYLRNSVIGCLTVMIDKEQISDFHIEDGCLEDVLTWMHYLKKGIRAYGLNENLASYRLSANSKSSKKIRNAQCFYQCLRQQEGVGPIMRLYSQMGYIYHASKKRLFSKRT